MQADERLELGLLVGDALLLAEETVEQLGDRVGDGELEVHEAEDEGRRDGTDAKAVACADRCTKERWSVSGMRRGRWDGARGGGRTLRDDLAEDEDGEGRQCDCTDAAAENRVEEDGCSGS